MTATQPQPLGLPVPGEEIYNSHGQRIAVVHADQNGHPWYNKGTLDPVKHKFRGGSGPLLPDKGAWGTDLAQVNRLPPEGGVYFTLLDGTLYMATRAEFDQHGWDHDFGHGLQRLMDEKWWRKTPPEGAALAPAPALVTPAPASSPALVWKGAALELRVLPLTSLVASRFQPQSRAAMTPALRKLASSLDEMGQQQPILVHPQGALYGVLDGHRRWVAAELNGWTALQALINSSIQSDEDALRAIQEMNLQRMPYTGTSGLEGMLTSGFNWDEWDEMSTPRMQRMTAPWRKLFPDRDERAAMFSVFGTARALPVATKLRTYAGLPLRRQADVVRWLALAGPSKLQKRRAIVEAGQPTRAALKRLIDEMRPLKEDS